MEERAIKRLLIILGLSVIAILIFKSVMLNTATKVSKAANEKKQTEAAKQAAMQPASAVFESPAASSTSAMDVPTSAASGVSEGR